MYLRGASAPCLAHRKPSGLLAPTGRLLAATVTLTGACKRLGLEVFARRSALRHGNTKGPWSRGGFRVLNLSTLIYTYGGRSQV